MKIFFNKLSIKLQRFMYGRYGIDNLYRGLLWICIALMILSLILRSALGNTVYTVISSICTLIIIFAFYRVFSKNIEKRRKENEKWLAFENKIKKFFRLINQRWKFRKTHIFRKCPKCKAVLRLKKLKGKHAVSCPHCSEKFNVRVIF